MDYLFGQPVTSRADAADTTLRSTLRDSIHTSHRTDSTRTTLHKLFLASNDLRERVEVQKSTMQEHIPRAFGAVDLAQVIASDNGIARTIVPHEQRSV